MRLFVTLTKRKLLAAGLFAAIILFVLLSVRSAAISLPDGSTNSLRMEFIESLGLSADDSAVTTKTVIIPKEFSKVYTEYNDLQLKGGFDLSDYKGKEATLYSYPLSEDRIVHLLVHKGRIIGGDVADTRIDGEIKPLKK